MEVSLEGYYHTLNLGNDGDLSTFSGVLEDLESLLRVHLLILTEGVIRCTETVVPRWSESDGVFPKRCTGEVKGNESKVGS